MLLQVEAVQPAVQPETIGTILGLSITNAMILGVVVTCLFALLALIVTRTFRLMPTKFQSTIEIIVESFLSFLEQIMGSRRMALQMLPLVGTIFLFFGVSNLIGLIPGLTAITYNGVPLLRTPTNDFNMTFSIALAVIILTQIASMRAFGIFGHLEKFVKIRPIFGAFRIGFGAGMMAILDFALGLLDIVSEIAKVFSLSLRLFGNMYAGEILMAVLLGAFALAVPTVWLAMNVLVGVLQAMVFGALTAAYYALAIQQSEVSEQSASA